MTITQILWDEHIDDIVAAEYDTVHIDVAAAGEGLSYQWQYKSPTGIEWKNTTLSGCTTDTLSIFCVHPGHDGYSLRCVVTTSKGQIFIASTVLHILGVRKHPHWQYVKEGATAKFTIAATGDVAAYQWQYMAPGNEEWIDTTFVGSKTDILIVPATAERSGHIYRCKITDTAGNVVYSHSSELIVK